LAVRPCQRRNRVRGAGGGGRKGAGRVAEQAGLGFGGLLRQLRDDAGLTQEELAEAAQVSQRAVSDLERGINRTARKDTAVLLADALGLDGRARELFVSAARGRASASDVLAAVHARPPGRSAAARALPGNLPAQLASFIGRERELAEIRALVSSSRLVTLTGAGGCGKTRLALQLAAGLLDWPGDGVWLVELAAVTDPDAVASAACRALGIAAQPGRPPLDTLLDALAPQAVLIVLDNCEHLIGGCAVAAEAIARSCLRVHLVATSREPLGIGGEAIYKVAPLSLPGPGESGVLAAESSDAVALFVERARAQGTGLPVDGQTAPLVISICRRLDGLPLAIELAAARLRSLSLRSLADRLDQRFRLLTGGSRTALARQQTLEAAVEWSYSLLNPAEQLLLRRLPVFAESFDLDAAEAVCGVGDIKALEVAGLLGSLVDKSLVCADLVCADLVRADLVRADLVRADLVRAEPAGPSLRYRLLETIRQFALDRLAEAGDDQAAAVAAAHCAHYLSAAETAAPYLTGPGQGSWLARLDADQANFRRAAEHAAGEPDGTSQVLRFGVALWGYWLVRYRIEEVAGLLVPALRRPEAAADPVLFAEALLAAARVIVDSDLATSLRLAEQADEVAGRLGNDRLLVMSRTHLARAYIWAGEPERARAMAREAVGRARQLGDDVLLGTSLMAQAHAVGAAASGPLYVEAIACTERSGHLRLRLSLYNNAGCAALEMGDIPAARAHLEAALRVAETIGEPHPIPSQNLGWVLRAEHDLDRARSRFSEALRTSRRVGSNRGMAGTIDGLACLATDLGDWDRAAALHGAAQALLDQTGVRLEPLDDRYRQESLGQARAAVGDEQVQRAYARGMALSLEQVIDLALGAVPSGT
jgi:predicted ATPase/DNA-binding XRE family transcriptional regulator